MYYGNICNTYVSNPWKHMYILMFSKPWKYMCIYWGGLQADLMGSLEGERRGKAPSDKKKYSWPKLSAKRWNIRWSDVFKLSNNSTHVVSDNGRHNAYSDQIHQHISDARSSIFWFDTHTYTYTRTHTHTHHAHTHKLALYKNMEISLATWGQNTCFVFVLLFTQCHRSS